jgi:hypothetical protein
MIPIRFWGTLNCLKNPLPMIETSFIKVATEVGGLVKAMVEVMASHQI